MSRLKREGNPPSGQWASPVPQAWDPSISDFRELTGQNLGGGRFGADGVQWGKTASGLFVPIRVTNDGTQEVQLSGNLVVSETLFPRQVRQQGETSRILRTPPAGAKGFVVKHIIYGATGNFLSEQGSKLFVETRAVNDASGTYVLFSVPITPTYTLGHHQVVVVHPGITSEGIVAASGRQIKTVNTPASLFNWIFFTQTSGTFTAGQGVDSEVILQWIT